MDYVVALLPSIGLGIIFVIVLRAILLADSRERAAIRALDEAERASTDVGGRDNSADRN